jgi:PTS system nitrogen regulatory IIA component
MNTVSQLITPSDVLLRLDASSGRELFEAVAKHCEAAHQLVARQIADALIAREKLGSTGLGKAVAIPHARIKGLTLPVGTFARPVRPIAFGAPDGKPVEYFFVLLVPEKATEQHLQILAVMAEMLADDKYRAGLGSCAGPE